MAELQLVVLTTLILGLAFLGGFLSRYLKQSPILGYILAGLVAGPLSSRFFAESGQEVLSFLAGIGVSLLLFTLGLELSFKKLAKVRQVVIWGGIIQILAVILWGLLLLPILGFNFYSSLFIASACSLSSTAVVLKILSERGEIDTLPGEIMLGWLLIQDLAVLPMMIILPSVGLVNNVGLTGLVVSIVKASAFLAIALVLGRKIVPHILSKVADFKSQELMLLSAVSLCLIFSLLTQALGLSLALGAFLAGVIISSSGEKIAIFSQIKPLRDFFSIIFFVSLGIFINPAFLAANIVRIIGLSFLIVFAKFLVVILLVLYLGYHLKTATLVAVGLVQVGEFSFILAQTALDRNLIGKDVYSLILSVAITTIILTPWFIRWAPKLYLTLTKLIRRRIKPDYLVIPEEELAFKNHIVICGYGRIGSWLGRALQLLDIPFIVVDYDHQITESLKGKGISVVYGDPADLDVLDYAQVDKASIVVITLPDKFTQELVIANCHRLNPKVRIISRVHHQEDQARLKALGVEKVIQPEFEASLSIIHRVLHFLNIPSDQIGSKIKRIKLEHGMN